MGAAEAERAVHQVGGFPAIVKPRRGAGGRGVTRVHTADELELAIERARRANGPGPHGVLVQELIAGRSVGVEAFFRDGGLAAAFVLDDQFEAGYVSPAGHSLPSTLPPALERAVVFAVDRIGQALGLHAGPANFDLRLRNREVIALEVNPRLGGNSITDLIRHAFGVDLPEATVCAALGGDPRALLARKKSEPTAARLILKHAHGVARLHDAPQLFSERADVLALDLLVREAELAELRVDDWTILGRSLVRAADSCSAALLAERVATSVAAHIELR
jgi:biotin carboxylase